MFEHYAHRKGRKCAVARSKSQFHEMTQQGLHYLPLKKQIHK